MKNELHQLRSRPVVASVTMGYGHLRAARPLAEQLGVDVLAIDEPPVADAREVWLWDCVRRVHELLSKPMPFLGPFDKPARGLMDALTMIPSLHERRDHRAPTWSVRVLDRLIQAGLGRGMIHKLRQSNAPLVTTFYAPAVIADRAGIEDVYCVVTDADCNRVWASYDPPRTRIKYCAPTPRVVRRLQSFGVPARNIFLTGFPLPPLLTAPQDTSTAESRLVERIIRLDPRGVFRKLFGPELARFGGGVTARDSGPPHLMFAVGGAGAQAEMVQQFLPSLAPLIVEGRLHLDLACGTRPEVRRSFVQAVAGAGLESMLGDRISICGGEDFESYYEAFNTALLRTDVLWTKPSELSFYPALGLACVIARPVGAHERYNRRWLREQGIGLKQRRLDHTRGWFEEWLEDGTLAAAAWSGFVRLPKHGTASICELVGGARSAPSADLTARSSSAPSLPRRSIRGA